MTDTTGDDAIGVERLDQPTGLISRKRTRVSSPFRRPVRICDHETSVRTTDPVR